VSSPAKEKIERTANKMKKFLKKSSLKNKCLKKKLLKKMLKGKTNVLKWRERVRAKGGGKASTIKEAGTSPRDQGPRKKTPSAKASITKKDKSRSPIISRLRKRLEEEDTSTVKEAGGYEPYASTQGMSLKKCGYMMPTVFS